MGTEEIKKSEIATSRANKFAPTRLAMTTFPTARNDSVSSPAKRGREIAPQGGATTFSVPVL